MLSIEKKVIEQVRLESHLSSEIFNKIKEFREEGYTFEPVNNYMDKNSQIVLYAIGIKDK